MTARAVMETLPTSNRYLVPTYLSGRYGLWICDVDVDVARRAVEPSMTGKRACRTMTMVTVPALGGLYRGSGPALGGPEPQRLDQGLVTQEDE